MKDLGDAMKRVHEEQPALKSPNQAASFASHDAANHYFSPDHPIVADPSAYRAGRWETVPREGFTANQINQTYDVYFAGTWNALRQMDEAADRLNKDLPPEHQIMVRRQDYAASRQITIVTTPAT